VTDAKLKSLVERVKTLLEEQTAIGADITQACKDAKEADPDLEPAMIRFAARELLMDEAKRNERDDKRARYLHAIGLAVEMVSNGDVSLRQAAKATGVSKSSIHKALAVHEVSTDHREMVTDDLGDPLWIVDKDRARFRDRVRAIAAKVKTLPELDAALDTLLPEDDLIIPDFLRRVRA
jgi:uncharacterized protein (UPF0335 family)